MLHQFLTVNRTELIKRYRLKVSGRSDFTVPLSDAKFGVPIFLDQLIKTLGIEETTTLPVNRAASRQAGSDRSEMALCAAQHGHELLQQGVTIDQVVHDYGDLSQAITDLAVERNAIIAVDEFALLNRCLDEAIAWAVAEYSTQRDLLSSHKANQALNERLGELAHELRNDIHTAILAVSAIKNGMNLAGTTGVFLERCLIRLRRLIDRSLAEVRVAAGMPARTEVVCMADFVGEIRAAASLEAQARECRFVVSSVDPDLAVATDCDLLHSAVWNVLKNAFRCTRHHSEVSLKVYGADDRILIEVEDHCGGLSPDIAETMFSPFGQTDHDRSGMGLGLSICRRSVEAINGRVDVRNLPGSGCVFSIALPRCTASQQSTALHS